METTRVERIVGCKVPPEVILDANVKTRHTTYGQKMNIKFLVKWQNTSYEFCTFEDEAFVSLYPNELDRFLSVVQRVIIFIQK
jgi:hypothetical protein